MTMIARFKCIHGHEETETARQEKIRDAVSLHIARILIVTLVAMLGFLLSYYFESIGQSIEKIGAGQERLSITAARIDEALQNIDRRLSRLENQPH